LARSGDSLASADLLDLQLAHAHARDAIHREVDFARLAAATDWPSRLVHSAALSRDHYIRRPDLGRTLDEPSRALLAAEKSDRRWDAVFIVADGLSSAAIERHALPLLAATQARLAGWRLAPLILAGQARVGLSDEIGALIGADLAVMLIGERPGLSVMDGLGVYLTWQPRPGRQDAERNCLSNIHGKGLGYDLAADKLVWLMTEARHLRLSGVGLKEDASRQALPPG
jgi:ethanolamine ammonia-lyase small subunit